MTKPEPSELAKFFHDAYEQLAPAFGYQTRTDTKQYDPSSANGKLMTAVCARVIDAYLPKPDGDAVERVARADGVSWHKPAHRAVVASVELAMARAALERFNEPFEGMLSEIVQCHQLRASAAIMDRQTKRETGWADTSDRAEHMRKAADTIERLAAAMPDPLAMAIPRSLKP